MSRESARIPFHVEPKAKEKHHGSKVEGRAVGEKIISGRARVIEHLSELSSFVPGEILVADTTSPDWGTVMKAAAAIGDDRLQKMGQGHVQPERWTHGSSAQRMTWLRRGLESGDPNVCNTFEGHIS